MAWFPCRSCGLPQESMTLPRWFTDEETAAFRRVESMLLCETCEQIPLPSKWGDDPERAD